MTKKELIEIIENIEDDEEVVFYVMDAEYETENGDSLYDMGIAKIVEVEKSSFDGKKTWITLHVNGR